MQKVVSSTVNVHFRLLNKGCRFSSFPAETRTQIEFFCNFKMQKPSLQDVEKIKTLRTNMNAQLSCGLCKGLGPCTVCTLKEPPWLISQLANAFCCQSLNSIIGIFSSFCLAEDFQLCNILGLSCTHSSLKVCPEIFNTVYIWGLRAS